MVDNFGAGADEGTPNSKIVVRTEHGAQIGGSFTELQSKMPEALTRTVHYELERWDSIMDGLTAQPPVGEEEGFWPGVRIHAKDGEIVNVYAPVSFLSDC